MAEQAEDAGRRRPRFSRERVVEAALAIADADGLGALTIRSLATELGVKPMSVYYHVASKDEILAALVDIVFGEIVLPVPGRDWRPEMERRADSAREVLARHRWAIGLLESRPDPGRPTCGTTTPSSPPCRRRVLARDDRPRVRLIDSYVYGFALQEAACRSRAGGASATSRGRSWSGWRPAATAPRTRWRDVLPPAWLRLRRRVPVRARPHPRRLEAAVSCEGGAPRGVP